MAAPLPPCEDLGIHADTIIAHADGEIDIAEGHFGLDMAGLCMLVRIADSLAGDAVSLVTNFGSQIAPPALDDDAVLRLDGTSIPASSSLPSALNEVARSPSSNEVERRSWTASRPSPIAWSPTCMAESRNLRGIARGGEQLPNGLQPEHQALEALQQGVVQLPGDPAALVEAIFHALLEPPAYLADPQADQSPHGGGSCPPRTGQ